MKASLISPLMNSAYISDLHLNGNFLGFIECPLYTGLTSFYLFIAGQKYMHYSSRGK
jgi:hypothetical protein